MVVEQREVAGFDIVELKGIGDLTITQGDREYFTIEADEQVLRDIISEVSGGKLTIRFDPWSAIRSWTGSKTVKMDLGVVRLRSVTVSGSTTLTAGIGAERLDANLNGAGSVHLGFNGDALRCELAGSGDFVVSGRTSTQEVRISGAGNYDGRQLESAKAVVNIAGAGKAHVRVAESLDVTVGGMGTVTYIGDPTVTQHIGGFGRVEKAEG